MITKVTERDVLDGCRKTLGLADDREHIVDDILLAALLRHSAGIHCPCSRITLRAALLECLQHLSPDETPLSDRIDTIIEGLIVGGDLLELHDVTTVDPDVKGTWVFAAPPSYVVRPSGEIFLLGIVPDQDVFLPELMASRISFEGLTRVIVPGPGEDLPAELDEQGLQRLSEDAWLKSPRKEQPENLLGRFNRQLTEQPPSGAVNDLTIVDSERPVTYYRGRWVNPGDRTGIFVGRRPQDYGAPIWCLVELGVGAVVRLLDLPPTKSRWRGCDEAWHLQMAIDHCRRNPQIYRRWHEGDGVRFDFLSPLPEWSQRRFMIFGRPVPSERSLLSYRLSAEAAEIEERFLRERLWLSRMDDAG